MYLSADELLDLERARLALRARGMSVDRGRLVREAIAVLLADLGSGVDASLIARRLRAAAVPLNGSGAVSDAILLSGAAQVSGMVPVDGVGVMNGAVPVHGSSPAGGLPAESQ